MSALNKNIIITIILIVIIAIAGYFYYSGLKSSNFSATKPTIPFHGPTGAPHVNGPKTLPPTGK